jgi:hypothetical protein
MRTADARLRAIHLNRIDEIIVWNASIAVLRRRKALIPGENVLYI